MLEEEDIKRYILFRFYISIDNRQQIDRHDIGQPIFSFKPA